jgi:L,D-peptidoglycan transpeptidase YkuD (ErfK/YbiS/YcfS/YnhG family)
MLRVLLVLLALAPQLGLAGEVVGPQHTQLVLARTAGWDASHATVQRYQLADGAWVAVGQPAPARVGREGLAWGAGLHPMQEGVQKVEGDWRAPAGVFELGAAFGDKAEPPVGVRWPYQTVTERHLWVEDASSLQYNQLVVLPGDRPLTSWETSQRMRLGDTAHRLKLVVEHNAAPRAVLGAGSAVFLHIWRRDGEAPTSGCTAMAADDLTILLAWLEPNSNAVFALLPADASALARAWGLPP